MSLLGLVSGLVAAGARLAKGFPAGIEPVDGSGAWVGGFDPDLGIKPLSTEVAFDGFGSLTAVAGVDAVGKGAALGVNPVLGWTEAVKGADAEDSCLAAGRSLLLCWGSSSRSSTKSPLRFMPAVLRKYNPREAPMLSRAAT